MGAISGIVLTSAYEAPRVSWARARGIQVGLCPFAFTFFFTSLLVSPFGLSFALVLIRECSRSLLLRTTAGRMRLARQILHHRDVISHRTHQLIGERVLVRDV